MLTEAGFPLMCLVHLPSISVLHCLTPCRRCSCILLLCLPIVNVVRLYWVQLSIRLLPHATIVLFQRRRCWGFGGFASSLQSSTYPPFPTLTEVHLPSRSPSPPSVDSYESPRNTVKFRIVLAVWSLSCTGSSIKLEGASELWWSVRS
jgi:hypothetical protein